MTGRPWLTVTDAAAHTGFSAYTIREAARMGRLVGAQTGPGGRWRFRVEDLDAWITSGRREPGEWRRPVPVPLTRSEAQQRRRTA